MRGQLAPLPSHPLRALLSIDDLNAPHPQVPLLGLSLRCLPTVFGTTAGSIALFNNFKVILVERGAGRNGSTVAVSSCTGALCTCLGRATGFSASHYFCLMQIIFLSALSYNSLDFLVHFRC